jgi:hypothetical protein
LLFIMYISAIASITKRHNVNRISYADDIQLYASVKVDDIDTLLNKIQLCVNEISRWLTGSQLVFNAGKTELLICGTRQQLSKLPNDISITIDGSVIKPSKCVRDLGVWLDPHLTFKDHVNKVTRSALLYLRVISRQRHHLNDKCTSLLIHSLVFTRIDYCSSLFYNINQCELVKLQGIINYAARVLKKMRKSDDVRHVITMVKWLRMKQRIQHRIGCLMYKILNTGKPHSLAELFKPCSSTVNTRRSCDPYLLNIPLVRTVLGERSFKRCGATVWNMLSPEAHSSSNSGAFARNSMELLFSQS